MPLRDPAWASRRYARFASPVLFYGSPETDISSIGESSSILAPTRSVSLRLIHSFLQPTDKAFPMVAAKDVGRVAAELIQEDWSSIRVVEFEGPSRVKPNDLADAFATVLGKPVRAVPVPRESWHELFTSQGMKNPVPRMRMLDGFNEGWIDFKDSGRKAIKGWTNPLDVIAVLIAGQIHVWP